jgi:hypothetical protein
VEIDTAENLTRSQFLQRESERFHSVGSLFHNLQDMEIDGETVGGAGMTLVDEQVKL